MSVEKNQAVAGRYFDEYLGSKGRSGVDLFVEGYRAHNRGVPVALDTQAHD